MLRPILIFLALMPTMAFAEELSGTITWPDGRPAAGVTMTIGSYSVVSKRDGGYLFDFLAPGEYVLTIGVPGKRSHAEQVRIEQGRKSEKSLAITW